jgi:hypothetical protein
MKSLKIRKNQQSNRQVSLSSLNQREKSKNQTRHYVKPLTKQQQNPSSMGFG